MSGTSETNKLVDTFCLKYKQDPMRFTDLPGVSGSWDPAQLVKLYNFSVQEPKPSQEEMAAIVKVHRSSISRKMSSMDWGEFEDKLQKLCLLSDEEYFAEQAREERLNSIENEVVRGRKNHISSVALMQHLEEKILTSTKALPTNKLSNLIYKPNRKKTRTPEHMVLILSDMHVGQEFSSRDTGGLNAYNLDILRQRVEKLRKGVTSIFEHHSELYELPELHVFGLGDFVQGGNQNGAWGGAYNATIDVHEQAVLAGEYISQLLVDLSQFFKKINFTGVVGNHGRAGATKNSDKVSANWDNIVYALIKARLANHKNVNIDYSHSWWAQKNVNGTEFVLLHGDHVSCSINSLQKEEQRMQSLLSGTTNKRFNYLVCGHFHTHHEVETSMGGVIVNGSFVGGDVHSMHQLRNTSRPTQTILGIHEKRGITWKYCIDLR